MRLPSQEITLIEPAVRLLRTRPGLSTVAIGRSLNVHRNRVCAVVTALRQAGIVKPTRSGRGRMPAPELVDVLQPMEYPLDAPSICRVVYLASLFPEPEKDPQP